MCTLARFSRGVRRCALGAVVWYGLDVATVIVSDETIMNLIEAHASMAAWYYQMSDALRQAGATATPPTDEQRKAYVDQLAHHFPELSAVARSITVARPYVPPPAIPAPTQVVENEGVTTPAPPENHIAAPAMIATASPEPPAPTPAAEAAAAAHDPAPPMSGGAAPPPPPIIVDPSKVKYDED